MLTAETQWIMPGRGLLSGIYRGPDEIFGLWKRIAEKSGGGLQLELRDVLANDDHAVALVRFADPAGAASSMSGRLPCSSSLTGSCGRAPSSTRIHKRTTRFGTDLDPSNT